MHVPINAFKTDFNGTRISDFCDQAKSCLRLKEEMKSHCNQFNAPYFLVEEQWKHTAEIEAVMNDTSRLTTNFQNEEKLNAACGTVVTKTTHDGSSSASLEETHVDTWSKNKLLKHPKRVYFDTDCFTIIEKFV